MWKIKKFKFRLQPVLNYRQRKEDALKRELALAKQQFEQEKSLLEDVKLKLSNLQQEVKVKQQSSFDASEAIMHSNHINRIEREIEIRMIRLADIASEVRKIQERLVTASKDKKILEKLHDKKYEWFKKETDKLEQASLDELATIRQGQLSSLKENKC
ncbi:MAG: flagellar export protein FliJ [Actinomycetota bacterium]|nr:flagellar export protein FliJ [Actinomycetota bacterium]